MRLGGFLFFLVLFPLCFAHRVDVGPEAVEDGADFLLACGEVAVYCFPAFADAIIKVEFCNLLGESSLDVFNCETTGAGMAGFDN